MPRRIPEGLDPDNPKVESIEAKTLIGADVENATADTVPQSQGDGTLAMGTISVFNPSEATNKTGDRQKGTVYQNTTGSPIFLNVLVEKVNSYQMSGELGVGASSTNINQVDSVQIGTENYDRARFSLSAVVPDGYYYRVTTDGSLAEYEPNWFEQVLL